MPLYENVFIARQDISGAQVDALADGFTQLIAEQGGEIKKREYWGLRNLAYRMKKNRKGGGINGKPERRRRTRSRRSRPASVFPPTQILPVFRAERAKDRLQGCAAFAALCFRARQDRAEPHHRRLDAEAARARAGDQAGAVSRPPPLCRELKRSGSAPRSPRSSDESAADNDDRRSLRRRQR